MAAYGGSFESSKSIEDKKAFKRQAREEVLREAKEKHEKEERRKELKRIRGEDTWMLPEVDLRLEKLDQEHSGKDKKKKEKKSKKSKKEKKKKVKKERRRPDEGSSSDSSEDGEDEWVEALPQAGDSGKAWKVPSQARPAVTDQAGTSQRDEWMTFDFLSMRTTSVAERRAEKEKAKEAERAEAQAIEQAGLHKLELNPFWKDGGSGLPSEDNAGATVRKAAVVNDGGLSWLGKSYQRMREQAEREQRSVEAVVAERYGSMEKFQERLEEAEKAAYAQRRGGREPGRDVWRRRGPPASEGRYDRDGEFTPAGGRGRERVQGEGRSPPRQLHGDGERVAPAWRHRDGRAEDTERRPREGLCPDREFPRSHGESHRPGRRPEEPPLSRSSLKAKFLKPLEKEDDAGWAVKREAPVSSAGSSRDAEGSGGAVPAWKKAGSGGRDSGKSAERERSSHAVLRDDRTEDHRAEGESSAATVVGPSSRAQESSPRAPVSEEEEETVQILSDEEMNKLGAKLVKAELMGNKDQVEKLKAQLDAARKGRESQARKDPSPRLSGKAGSQVSGRVEEDQEVVLFRTDQTGRAWPVCASSQTPEPKGGRRKKTAVETHQDGERVRYFQDDDRQDLREMVRREKMSSAQDQNALYSRMAAKMMGKPDGDNYTLDDMFVSGAAQKERPGREEERQRDRAIQEHRRLAGSMEKCRYCFDSPELPKHLIVAIGVKVYLCLPNSMSLTEGHCLIAPLQHHCCATGLDEDVWGEIQMFRKALVKMFQDQDQDCVFLETHMNPKRRQHMVYECIPLPRELGDMAPIYFKKAIMESDEEWSMNKKVVDLSKKDIRHAVPKGLPYFSVDFGFQGGFAHVIENEQKFPHYFGKEIIGGMMDLEPRRWRKPIRENFDDQRKKVLQFAQWWKPFDCTKTDG